MLASNPASILNHNAIPSGILRFNNFVNRSNVEQQLEALERTKAEIADQKVRAQTAAEIELLVRNMTEAAAEFDAAAARLSDHTGRAVPWLFEVRGLDDFVNVGRVQVPLAVDMVTTMLQALADDVVSGKAPATLPRGGDEASVQAAALAQPPKEPQIKYQVVREPMYKGFAS
jgi:hypothetical protein